MPSEDWLGLTDEAESRAAQGPAFVAPVPLGPREMEVMERMHRMEAKGCYGAELILFVEEDGEMEAAHAKMWQTLLRWPRPPTVDEVMAIKLSRQARLVSAYWSELRDAVAADAADGFVANVGPRERD